MKFSPFRKKKGKQKAIPADEDVTPIDASPVKGKESELAVIVVPPDMNLKTNADTAEDRPESYHWNSNPPAISRDDEDGEHNGPESSGRNEDQSLDHDVCDSSIQTLTYQIPIKSSAEKKKKKLRGDMSDDMYISFPRYLVYNKKIADVPSASLILRRLNSTIINDDESIVISKLKKVSEEELKQVAKDEVKEENENNNGKPSESVLTTLSETEEIETDDNNDNKNASPGISKVNSIGDAEIDSKDVGISKTKSTDDVCKTVNENKGDIKSTMDKKACFKYDDDASVPNISEQIDDSTSKMVNQEEGEPGNGSTEEYVNVVNEKKQVAMQTDVEEIHETQINPAIKDAIENEFSLTSSSPSYVLCANSVDASVDVTVFSNPKYKMEQFIHKIFETMNLHYVKDDYSFECRIHGRSFSIHMAAGFINVTELYTASSNEIQMYSAQDCTMDFFIDKVFTSPPPDFSQSDPFKLTKEEKNNMASDKSDQFAEAHYVDVDEAFKIFKKKLAAEHNI